MSEPFLDLVRGVVGDDPTVETIVAALERRGFLASPVRDGYSDRQVRIYLIQQLGRRGDPAALDVLRSHAELPDAMGQGKVAEAARAAIARIEGGAEVEPATVTDPFDEFVGRASKDLEALMSAPSHPSALEAAGLRGVGLREKLLELDASASRAVHGGGAADPQEGARRVQSLLLETGCDADIVEQVRERLEDPHDEDRWFDVTILLRQAGHFHGALEAYDNAVDYFDSEIRSMLWSNRGLLLLAWERYREAIASFRKALEIRPTYHRARSALGDAYRLLHEFEKAVACYEAVVEAVPENSVVWDLLGICREQMGDADEAIACLERAVASDPGNVEALVDLARVHSQRGSFDMAEACLARLMDLDPENPVAPALREAIDRREPFGGLHQEAFKPRRLLRLARESAQPGRSRARPYTLLSPANLAIEDPAVAPDALDSLVRSRLEGAGGDSPPGRPEKETIFISYKWESQEHRAWVWRFAGDLESRGYRVIYDQYEGLDIRDELDGVTVLRTERMGDEVPELVGELARSDVFLPILTEGYRRCVDPLRVGELAGTISPDSLIPRLHPDDGWVFDEWQVALRLRLTGALRWQGIWRQGPVVPPPFVRGSVWDFRDDDRYEELLAARFPEIP
jgi:tetratricopeptide (TPR) repeat protein